jgi:hypothetical protein
VSSHREAPEISKDPVADNTDVYAFVSPDRPDTVTIVANWLPFEGPSGGPNFYEFGDDVLYSIYIDNDGDAQPEIEYQFRFVSTLQNPDTFLYNTGPITSLTDANWNARQLYSVTRIDAGPKSRSGRPAADAQADPGPAFPPGPTFATVLGTNLPCPPCNIGPNSTPSYADLAAAAISSLGTGEGVVFCGQRNDPFYVDLGAIFDLADLRPFQHLHLSHMTNADGVDATKQLNIHTIAIQVPITRLTRDGSRPTDVASSTAVLGVWSGASRRKARVFDDQKNDLIESGPWVQVSRLGNPLFNEVIVHLGQKDDWNRGNPVDDGEYLPNVQHPELAHLLPVLYPGDAGLMDPFKNLRQLTDVDQASRDDLVAILLTGLPPGLPGLGSFQNFTGSTPADMLRLNVAVRPAAKPSNFGILGGDLAGFPNGRRVFDDIVAIELRAIAGATYPLVNPSYTPDAAAGILSQWMTEPASSTSSRYLSTFPYVGTPYDGFHTPAS